jgi:Domain of unknown function (DUF4352)
MQKAGARSKITWILIGLGALVIGVVALSLTVLDDETGSRGEAASPAAVGEPVVLHDVRYEVTGVRTARRLFEVEQPTEFDEPRRTSGIFVAVDVALTNDGDEPASASFHGSSLVGGNGQTYPLDSLSLGTFYALEPDLAERGRLVFDIPPGAASGAVLVIADCPLDAAGEPADCTDARIDLGLP